MIYRPLIRQCQWLGMVGTAGLVPVHEYLVWYVLLCEVRRGERGGSVINNWAPRLSPDSSARLHWNVESIQHNMQECSQTCKHVSMWACEQCLTMESTVLCLEGACKQDPMLKCRRRRQERRRTGDMTTGNSARYDIREAAEDRRDKNRQDRSPLNWQPGVRPKVTQSWVLTTRNSSFNTFPN